MKFKSIFKILVVVFIIYSCKVNPQSSLDEAHKHYTNYIITDDITYLDSCYTILADKIPHQINTIQEYDFHLIANVYLSLRKNEEFEVICDQLLNRKLNEEFDYLVRIKSNLNKYLITREEMYIKESFEIVNSRLQQEKSKESVYVDYFTIMLHKMKDKDMVLAKIDSFQMLRNQFLESFYKFQLKEFIAEYPEVYYK